MAKVRNCNYLVQDYDEFPIGEKKSDKPSRVDPTKYIPAAILIQRIATQQIVYNDKSLYLGDEIPDSDVDHANVGYLNRRGTDDITDFKAAVEHARAVQNRIKETYNKKAEQPKTESEGDSESPSGTPQKETPKASQDS